MKNFFEKLKDYQLLAGLALIALAIVIYGILDASATKDLADAIRTGSDRIASELTYGLGKLGEFIYYGFSGLSSGT